MIVHFSLPVHCSEGSIDFNTVNSNCLTDSLGIPWYIPRDRLMLINDLMINDAVHCREDSSLRRDVLGLYIPPLGSVRI